MVKIDINKISEKVINDLKQNYELPSEGFLAGGSISNLIWQEVSGNKAIINDIDIFIPSNEIGGFSIKEDFKGLKQEYKHVDLYNDEKTCYKIIESNTNGVINTIKYNSPIKNNQLIIDSFDLNCCACGYDIQEDKFYYNDSFLEFLETKEIKPQKLNTPQHTALRYVKKSFELGLPVCIKELIFYQEVIYSSLNSKSFGDKYKKIFDEYKIFNQFFILEINEYKTRHLKGENKDYTVYDMKPYGDFDRVKLIRFDMIMYNKIIKGNEIREAFYKHLPYFNENYYKIDSYNIIDVQRLKDIFTFYKSAIVNVNHLSYIEQVNLVKKLDSFYKDKTTVDIIMNNNKMVSDPSDIQLIYYSIKSRRDIQYQKSGDYVPF